MTVDGALELLRNAIFAVAALGGPALLAALTVGLVVGVMQTATQINEPSIGFIFKLLAVGLTFAALGPHMVVQSIEYTRRTIGGIAEIVR